MILMSRRVGSNFGRSVVEAWAVLGGHAGNRRVVVRVRPDDIEPVRI